MSASASGTSAPAPLSAAEQIKQKIADLQTALQQQSPGYESLLHTIHVALAKDEEATALLTEDEIGVIVAGLSKKKNVVIAETVAKSKSTKNTKWDDI